MTVSFIRSIPWASAAEMCIRDSFKAAVLPLSKKLSDGAREVYASLARDFMVDFDDAGSIGKRYRRQDEIGTP